MEYCSHCRAIRPTRKSSRRRTVRLPEGGTKTVVVESLHCGRCHHFISSIERDLAPAPAGAPAEAGAPTAEPDEE